ncbi:MAG: DUF2809 domain-containing protein [Bacteroidetes bacterium]|nr:DUF2809 domain-containing protein [Bacteroidota bacterium]
MLRFSKTYFALTLFLFVVECLIGVYAHDRFIRPFIGDLLVVILIYCFLQTFFKLPVVSTAIAVLIFSFIIEALQYYNLVEMLGLQDSKLARIIIGTSFSWYDIWAYVGGIAIVLILESVFHKSNK